MHASIKCSAVRKMYQVVTVLFGHLHQTTHEKPLCYFLWYDTVLDHVMWNQCYDP